MLSQITLTASSSISDLTAAAALPCCCSPCCCPAAALLLPLLLLLPSLLLPHPAAAAALVVAAATLNVTATKYVAARFARTSMSRQSALSSPFNFFPLCQTPAQFLRFFKGSLVSWDRVKTFDPEIARVDRLLRIEISRLSS